MARAKQPESKRKRALEAQWKAIEEELDNDYPLTNVFELDLDFDAGAVEPLFKRMDDKDLRIVFAAGLALGRIDSAADAIVPLVVPRLSDPHPLVAEHARWIMRELGAAAIPALVDSYASRPKHKQAIATALGFQGPRAAAAAMVLREDARDDAAIAAALRELVGPWPTDLDEPLPYLGESVRLDAEGPPPMSYFGIELWLDFVQWAASMDEAVWDRTTVPDESLYSWRPNRWCPDQVVLAASQIEVGAYNDETGEVVKTTLQAANGEHFTKQELLWKLLDAHHRIAPCNDRIFEGLERQDDGSYYISTGS